MKGFYLGMHIQGLQRLWVWSPYTRASSAVSGVFMGLVLFPASPIRTTQQVLISTNLSEANDPRGGSYIHMAKQWSNYSAFIKVSRNTIAEKSINSNIVFPLLTQRFIYGLINTTWKYAAPQGVLWKKKNTKYIGSWQPSSANAFYLHCSANCLWSTLQRLSQAETMQESNLRPKRSNVEVVQLGQAA